MFAVVSAAAATSHSPAFLWSGRPSAGLLGGDYLHELSGAELQNTVAVLVSGTVTQPLVTKVATNPEVLAVFLHDELATEDVRTHGTDAFPVLQKLMADSPSSVSVPFTTRSASLSFEGATRVAADEAERYLEQHPALATNGKTDVLLIPLPASSGGQPGQRGAAFLEHDALVGRVAAAVAKATGGNYVALLTGKAGGSDDVQHLTMRRRLAEAEPQVGLRISPDLMAGLMVSFLLIIIFLNGFCCLFSLQTPKKFEEVKNA